MTPEADSRSTPARPPVVSIELTLDDALERAVRGEWLGAPVLFGAGTRRVLARLVMPSADLLALHGAVHARAGAGDDLPHTAAGVWVPHVTLARRVRLVDLPDAVRAVGGDLSGAATALRRWDSAQRLITPLA